MQRFTNLKHGLKTIVFIASCSLGAIALIPTFGEAQIIPDATLPNNSIVVPNVNILTITGGTQAGGNLFHSFREFSVPTGVTAFFNNSTAIQNILARVTGSAISNIDGLISANGTANLFLINPNGIIFGHNAALNIGGSFFASTANSMRFGDGNEFNATNPQASPLLTMTVPTGLQLGENSKGIQIEGGGQEFGAFGISNSFGTELGGLRVPQSKTLAIIGGAVNADGAILQATGGNIAIGGLSAAGTVNIAPNGMLSFPENIERADVTLTNRTGINAIADQQGRIEIFARNLEVSGLSLLTTGIAANGGTEASRAGDIAITTTGTTRIEQSRIENNVNFGAQGDSGNIDIQTGTLNTDSAALSTSNFGSGLAGDINITATDRVSLRNLSRLDSNGFFGRISISSAHDSVNVDNSSIATESSDTQTDPNQFSSISISAPTGEILLHQATLSTTNSDSGFAGDINLDARDRIAITNNSFLSSNGRIGIIRIGESILPMTVDIDRSTLRTTNDDSQSAEDVPINAGEIRINAASRLTLSNQSSILALTRRLGNAGDITINVENGDVILSEGSTIFSTVESTGRGNGGSIDVIARSLRATDGAQLLTIIRNVGEDPNAVITVGNITIKASDQVSFSGTTNVDLVGNPGLFPSGVLSSVTSGAVGDAGNIEISARAISITDGAKLASDNSSTGIAGSITLEAREQFFLARQSSIVSTSNSDDSENFGTIKITVPEGTIALLTEAKIDNTNTGSGFAGDIVLDAREQISVSDRSIISSDGRIGRILIGETITPTTIKVSNSRLTTRNDTSLSDEDVVINAGNISLNAKDDILLSDRSSLEALTGRLGSAGDVSLKSENGNIVLSEGSSIFSTVELEGRGSGGSINITAKNFSASDGGQILTVIRSQELDFSGERTAGDISIVASDQVTFSGFATTDLAENSGIFPSGVRSDVVADAIGSGGNISITAKSLSLVNSAELTANSEGSGGAGNIEVTVSSILLSDQAGITANTTAGEGNITLNADNLILRGSSNIATNAQGFATGGNIAISTKTLAALENSDITANAEESFGGRVAIAAQGIFGTRFRPSRTPNSDITASSELGADFSGVVEIQTPNVDPSQGLVTLSVNPVDISKLAVQSCLADQRGNEFIITGKGGLPASPSEVLNGNSIFEDLGTFQFLSPSVPQPINHNHTLQPIPHTVRLRRSASAQSSRAHAEALNPTPILEANNWAIAPNGKVMLTNLPMNARVYPVWSNFSKCVTP